MNNIERFSAVISFGIILIEMRWLMIHLKKNGHLKYYIINDYRAVVIILLFGLAGCGTLPHFQIYNSKVNVEVSTEEKSITPEKKIVIDYIEVQPKVDIKNVFYEYQTEKLLLEYSWGNNIELLMYDLKNKRKNWTALTNAGVNLFKPDFIVLNNNLLLEPNQGTLIREIEPHSALLDDSTIITVNQEFIAKKYLKSGLDIWSSRGYFLNENKDYFLHDNWFFIVDEGLYAINLSSGKSWVHRTPTSNSNALEALVLNIGIGLLSGLTRTTNPNYVNTDMSTQIYSAPIIEDNHVYFAAVDKIFCFELETGKVKWKQEFSPEMDGKMQMYNFSEGRIILLSSGFRKFNNAYESSLTPPSMLIIEKETGLISKRIDLKQDGIVCQFFMDSVHQNNYLVMTKQIQVYNKDMMLIAALNPKLDHGRFLRVLDTQEEIIIRTSNGILSLDKTSFEENRFVECFLEKKADRGLDLNGNILASLMYNITERMSSFEKWGYYFSRDMKYNIFRVYDRKNWQEITNFEMKGYEGGWQQGIYRGFENNKALLIRLDGDENK